MVRETISWLKTRIQEDLFPHLKKCFTDPLTEKQKQMITILEIVQIEGFVKSHLQKEKWDRLNHSDKFFHQLHP